MAGVAVSLKSALGKALCNSEQAHGLPVVLICSTFSGPGSVTSEGHVLRAHSVVIFSPLLCKPKAGLWL